MASSIRHSLAVVRQCDRGSLRQGRRRKVDDGPQSRPLFFGPGGKSGIDGCRSLWAVASKNAPGGGSSDEHPEIQERIIPRGCRGIKMISMAYFLHGENPASVRAPIANGVIKQFTPPRRMGRSEEYLDHRLPPGTGDIQLTSIQEEPYQALSCDDPPRNCFIGCRKGSRDV